jgi:exosome complex exonuclease DIS3/RRP44
VIHSSHSFTYDDAQTKLLSDGVDPVTMSIKHLNTLAMQLRQKRIDDGALVLASAQQKSGNVTRLSMCD